MKLLSDDIHTSLLNAIHHDLFISTAWFSPNANQMHQRRSQTQFCLPVSPIHENF